MNRVSLSIRLAHLFRVPHCHLTRLPALVFLRMLARLTRLGVSCHLTRFPVLVSFVKQARSILVGVSDIVTRFNCSGVYPALARYSDLGV